MKHFFKAYVNERAERHILKNPVPVRAQVRAKIQNWRSLTKELTRNETSNGRQKIEEFKFLSKNECIVQKLDLLTYLGDAFGKEEEE